MVDFENVKIDRRVLFVLTSNKKRTWAYHRIGMSVYHLRGERPQGDQPIRYSMMGGGGLGGLRK